MCSLVLSANVGLHQSSGILNAVFVTRDAVLPELLEPGALCGCIGCLWNTCGSEGLLAAGSWLAFRGEGKRIRTIRNYERWHFEIMYVLWLTGSKVLVSTKQVHNSLREQVVLYVWTQFHLFKVLWQDTISVVRNEKFISSPGTALSRTFLFSMQYPSICFAVRKWLFSVVMRVGTSKISWSENSTRD